MENSYLLVKSLKAAYRQKEKIVSVLDSIDFSLSQGKTGVIIGPSGCGKSTLLNVLAGLNSDYSGQVLINNRLPVGEGKQP